MKKIGKQSMIYLLCLLWVTMCAMPAGAGPRSKKEIKSLQHQLQIFQWSNEALLAELDVLDKEVERLRAENEIYQKAYAADKEANGKLDEQLASANETAAAAAAQELSQEEAAAMAGTRMFFVDRDVQRCCAKHIGGPSGGGRKCLDWVKETFANIKTFDMLQVNTCEYREEITGHMKGNQIISISYQIGDQHAQKEFSEKFFFKE